MEAAGLGLIMLSICLFSVLMEYPASPIVQALPDPILRRALIGGAVGLTIVGLIYSPWGRQSGAHYNPSVTLTFLRLGRIAPGDALGYILAQFTGGTLGMLLASRLVPAILRHPSVYYAATRPGSAGVLGAFLGETVVTFLQMLIVLRVSNTPKISRYTGLFAGSLIALFITVEAPISGMSMNPARTFASAIAAMDGTAIWVYFTAPFLGMLLAAQVYLWQKGRVSCAKLHHDNDKRCIFCAHHTKQTPQNLPFQI